MGPALTITQEATGAPPCVALSLCIAPAYSSCTICHLTLSQLLRVNQVYPNIVLLITSVGRVVTKTNDIASKRKKGGDWCFT